MADQFDEETATLEDGEAIALVKTKKDKEKKTKKEQIKEQQEKIKKSHVCYMFK